MICQYCGHKLTDGKCLNPACPGRLRGESVSELKPCPFCGGVAARDIILEDGSNYGGEIIGCKRCLASTRVFFGEKEGLEESWNTRTPAPAEVEDLLDHIISAANSVSIPSESNYLNELKSRLLAAFSNTTPYLSRDVSVPVAQDDCIERIISYVDEYINDQIDRVVLKSEIGLVLDDIFYSYLQKGG